MFITRVHASDLGHRLDASFFDPHLMDASRRVIGAFRSSRLDQLIDPSRRITNGVRGPDWQDSEYKLIRLQDCKDWVVDAANAASISFDQYQDNRRCKLEPEDIVVAIGGYSLLI
jgi:type I restriction enzyme, S subunit